MALLRTSGGTRVKRFRPTGPWARPDVDRVFVETLRANFHGAIKELPHHINDAAFADACVDDLGRLLTA
ncbi:MAG: Tm-1-like ATP-binding domain-containing protein [Xanthobacteraceae bacterium]